MENVKSTKIIEMMRCPSCGDEFYSARSFFSQNMWSLRKQDIESIKENLKKRVEQVQFKNEEEKKVVMSYLDSNVFGPDEVDSLVESITKNHT